MLHFGCCPLTCSAFRWDGESEKLASQFSNKLFCCEKEKQSLLEFVAELTGGLAGLRAQNAATRVTVFWNPLPSPAMQPRCGRHGNLLQIFVGAGYINVSDIGGSRCFQWEFPCEGSLPRG